MASVQTYLAKSFTGKQSGTPDESAIKLHAEVTPAELAPGVKWEVKADPGHYPNPPNVNAEPTGGDAVFTVTPLTPDRWPRDHEQSRELLPKQFSYVFTASVQDAQGQTHRSNEETATQDEIDTIREEYVEFGRHDPGTGNIPVRDVFQRKTSDHFKVWELNSGDYSLYWVQDVMLKGLERMRDMLEADYAVRNLDFSGFVLSSAFRNPVHHRFHTDPDPRNELTNDSPHQYGLAADIKIDNQPIPAEAFFEKLNWLAKYSAVGACFEPKVSITNNGKRKLDHAHVDWRNRCGSGWR
jgi:hypothetical protein